MQLQLRNNKSAFASLIRNLSYIAKPVILIKFCVVLRGLDEQNVGVDFVDWFVVMCCEELFQETLSCNGELKVKDMNQIEFVD